MKNFLLLILFPLCSLFVSAQNFEYGSASELKDLKKIHINTGSSVDDFNKIKTEIEKAGLKLSFVSTPEESDFGLIFVGAREERVNGALQSGNLTMIGREKIAVGRGMVVTAGTDGKRLRVLMNFESSQDKYGEKKPIVKFAREFIKAYKKANEIK